MLALLFWLRAAMGFQFQSVASTAGPLAAEFGISASALGALIGLYILPGFVVALPSGALASRLPDRATATAGLLVMAAGSIVMALAPSYAMLCAGRLLAGIGYALYTLVITKMVADWFTGREMFAAMGVMLASWPCGIALGLAVEPALAVAAGWPAAQWAVAALCIADAGLAAFLYRAPPERIAAPAVGARLRPDRREIALVLLASLPWGALNVGLIIFFSFGPRLLESTGHSPTAAAMLIAAGLWVSALALPLGGMIAERLRRPHLAAAISSVVGAAALGWLVLDGPAALASVLVGLSLCVPGAVIIALPASLLRPESLGIGLGLFYASYFLQMMLGPLIAGWVADLAGGPAAAVWTGAALLLACAALIGPFPEPAARQ
jgi:predicted MFS family arabinose efflux permease